MEEFRMPKTAEEIAAENAAKEKAKAEKVEADRLAAEKAAKEAERGFPADTPVESMTPTEQLAYWKFQSRKHEQSAKGRADYDDLKAKAAELEALKAKTATDEEKARDEARREGEVIGAEKYLKPAVMAKFQFLSGKTDEEVETIFEHVDALTFTDDKGEIDIEKLTKYSDTFGKKESGKPEDAVAAALARQRQAAGGGSASSIADKRKETREAMTSKTQA